MSSADKLKRFFKKAELSINPESDEKIFQDVLNAQQKTIKSRPVQSVNIGRIFMKSTLIKFAAVAIVIIACMAGFTMFKQTSSIALANVLTQIENIDAYMNKLYVETNQTFNDLPFSQKNIASMLVSKEYGIKIIEYSDSNSYVTEKEMYMITQKSTIITITPAQKCYTREEIDSNYIERTNKQFYDPVTMIKKILECDHKNIGRSTIEGIDVEGFQTTDPNYQGGLYSAAFNIDVKLWVNIKTKLPVRMEMNFKNNEINMSVVLNEFQWNIAVNESDFEPNIPQDYNNISFKQNIPPITEETAINGLKLFMNLKGKYPEKVTPDTLQPQVVMLKGAQDKMEFHNENPEEQANYQTIKNMDISNTIQGMALFCIMLNQEKKDLAYYGERVSPGDAGYVLMRWKVSDFDYRVIFGDLRAETIPFETLVQLEQNLPEE